MAEKADELAKGMMELSLLSFRKVDDIKRLARHFRNVINHPLTQENDKILKYLRSLDDTHRKVFLQKRESVEVEYIFTTEKKSSLQRQRFNSLPVSEVPELLKAELLTAENAKQVHICIDCNVEIELNDEVPLMESLQKHFNLDVHLPKLKRESIDVAEPIVLPNMSRRLSAMECGETPAQNLEQIMNMVKPMEKLDRGFAAKLEAALIRNLPDNSEASINAAVKFYQTAYDKLCREVSAIDFSNQSSAVAPIIMSIKDNVYQNFASDSNKNIENDENDTPDKPAKNQVKKYRYYGPIENFILKLLANHKLLSLVDDRTGKPAFFCMACEYYSLRFRYDSVLNHVFSESHIHNLSCILQADKHIPFSTEDRSMEKIKEMNRKFLYGHDVIEDASNGVKCVLCKTPLESIEASTLHILDENHLARLSDKLYRRVKANNPEGSIPDEWGPKDLDWTKFLGSTGKPVNNRDHVIIENFIKPSGKIANYCTCCDMTLKGPRQVLFNHIRQKKHLRNAAPHKLAMLHKNYCRPSEYYASFGNFYVCLLCPSYVAVPSFAAMVEHCDSAMHIESVARMVRSALYPNNADAELMALNKVSVEDCKCGVCDMTFQSVSDVVAHVLSSVEHQTAVAEAKIAANKGDIISVYMHGNYILHSEGSTFNCVACKEVFNSIRSLLAHLVYADHFVIKPSSECVFRFYLELKHNIIMLGRNKYVYYEFGRLKCGVCEDDVAEGENAKRHVVSPRHRESMGNTYSHIDITQE